MLDQLSQRSDALYVRAVRPPQEGNLRHDVQQQHPSHLTRSTNEVVQQQRDRVQHRREIAEQQRQVHAQEHQPSSGSSQSSQVAEKLFQQVQRARHETTREDHSRQSGPYRSAESVQRQKLDRTYVNDYPRPSTRFVDEIA